MGGRSKAMGGTGTYPARKMTRSQQIYLLVLDIKSLAVLLLHMTDWSPWSPPPSKAADSSCLTAVHRPPDPWAYQLGLATYLPAFQPEPPAGWYRGPEDWSQETQGPTTGGTQESHTGFYQHLVFESGLELYENGMSASAQQ